MIDDQGTILKYTNGTRIRNTKRLKYMKLRENHKKKLKILEIESELSNYNYKSCSYNVFKKYIIKKFEVNNKLTSIYSVDDYYKKLKWFSHLNTKRSEVKLIRLIKRTYGSDIIIIMGDWSQGKQMRHFMSTPNLSLKRLLAQEFTVYNVDEFRTSCLHYKTEKRCENLYLPDKKNKIKKIHSILTYKMENRRQGCIDRDKNGVKNIRKMVQNYLETDERPKRYCRGVILEETQINIKVNKRPRTFKKSNLKNVKSGQCSYRHASPKPT